MSEILSDLKYASSHEWVRVEADGIVTVGISDHAQGLLGDIVFVELPEVDEDAVYEKENDIAVVESVKAASDIYAPVSGVVVEVNEALEDAPETVNNDPYGDGWIFKLKISNPDQLNELLDAEAYAEVCEED